ncbi:helix-turn-helix domain-containing protein [Vallitalea sediminicola]
MNNFEIPILFDEKIFYEFKDNNRFLSLSYNKIAGSKRMFVTHFHPFYEVYYLKEGSANYLIEGELLSVKAGDVLLIKPYLLHKTLYPNNSNNIRYLISFNKTYFNYLPEDDISWFLQVFGQSYPIIRLDTETKRKWNQNLQIIRMEAKEKRNGYNFRIHSIMQELFLTIKKNGNSKPTINKDLTTTEQKILEVIGYIHSHYEEKLSLQLLGERFYISSYYLSHRFKYMTSYTLIEYIQLIRIKKAQELLETTKLRTIDICENCGFGSISQFNRVFKKVCGISPGKYRRNNGMI